MRLLLASGSATRRRMLESAGVPFSWAAPQVDEAQAKARLLAAGADAPSIARHLAELKALALPGAPDELVLGSDQVLEQDDGTILSKAGSRAEAAEQLRRLGGHEHRLHSAASLAYRGEVVWRELESVSLQVRSLSDSYIEAYLDEEWEAVSSNVGVYRIEGRGVQLFDSIAGSHFAILGLPLLPLLAELRRRGVLTP